jgi:hypothetical protein
MRIGVRPMLLYNQESWQTLGDHLPIGASSKPGTCQASSGTAAATYRINRCAGRGWWRLPVKPKIFRYYARSPSALHQAIPLALLRAA